MVGFEGLIQDYDLNYVWLQTIDTITLKVRPCLTAQTYDSLVPLSPTLKMVIQKLCQLHR